MAHPGESAEILALANRPASDRVRRLATVHQMSVKATPAEVTQARLFDVILQAETAELEQLACRLAGSLDRQPELDSHEVVPRDLLRIYERIEEVHRLLDALQSRFRVPA